MAIQPTIRTDGSRHLIRFQGNLLPYSGQGTRPNGTTDAAPVADVATGVLFFLFDTTDPTDETTQLPRGVYDDTVPAGSSPHAALPAWGPAVVAGVPTLAGVPTGAAWAQNIRVRAHEFSASTAAPLISRIDVLMPVVTRDPSVTLQFHFTAAGIAELDGVGVPVVVEFEIPHTIGR